MHLMMLAAEGATAPETLRQTDRSRYEGWKALANIEFVGAPKE